MVIKVEGELTSFKELGLGPFRRRQSSTERFSCLIATSGQPVQVLEGLTMETVDTPFGSVLQGELRGVQCLFGELGTDTSRSFTFSMLSVNGYELRGTASYAEPKPGSRNRYVV